MAERSRRRAVIWPSGVVPVTSQRSPLRIHPPSDATRRRLLRRVVTVSPTRMVVSPPPSTASPVSPARCRSAAIAELMSATRRRVGAVMMVSWSRRAAHQSAATAGSSASVLSCTRPRSVW